jgi:uncharacterized protein with FMN-binding domain
MKFIKKLFLPVALIVGFASYVLYGQQGTSASSTVADNSSNSTTSSNTTVAVNTKKGGYKDGTYTGDLVDAYYGNVQVVAIISGGQITDVQVPVYPSDRTTSLRLSQNAIASFKTEVIKTQTTPVNIVSGATQTSQGMSASLKTALVKAQG